MPADHRIDVTERIVYIHAWGRVTNEDLTGRRAALAADPDFRPEFDRIVYDFAGVTELEVSTETLAGLATSTLFAPSARRAVVVSSHEAFGLARMCATMTGGEDRIQVFFDHDRAMVWLKSEG